MVIYVTSSNLQSHNNEFVRKVSKCKINGYSQQDVRSETEYTNSLRHDIIGLTSNVVSIIKCQRINTITIIDTGSTLSPLVIGYISMSVFKQ